MSLPEHFKHDPARCVTCSPRIRDERMRPITEAITAYLETLAQSIRQAREETE